MFVTLGMFYISIFLMAWGSPFAPLRLDSSFLQSCLREGKRPFYIGGYSFGYNDIMAHAALLLYRLAAKQVALARTAAQNFAACRYLEAFGY